MLRHGIYFWGALMLFALPGLVGCTVFAPDQPRAPTPAVKPAAAAASAPRPEDDPELFLAIQGDLEEFARLKALGPDCDWSIQQIREGKHLYYRTARGVEYKDQAREEARKWERAGQALMDFIRWSQDHQWDPQGLGPWPGPGAW